MCRLLGIVAGQIVRFEKCLLASPRSLALLSQEHPHGWGTAIYTSEGEWRLDKGIACARSDDRFASIASSSSGEVLVAHVRQRTVGGISLANTHPFQRGRWVFAHNGTIEDMEFLRTRSSPQRLGECQGETDSELLFACLLTQLDEQGLTSEPATAQTDAILTRCVTELLARPALGSSNFLMSNGEVLYAHRFGRTLYILERASSPEQPGALLIGSEPVTEESWRLLGNGTLLRCDGNGLRVSFLLGEDKEIEQRCSAESVEVSRDEDEQELPELPFTD